MNTYCLRCKHWERRKLDGSSDWGVCDRHGATYDYTDDDYGDKIVGVAETTGECSTLVLTHEYFGCVCWQEKHSV
jgi:hypothetical protein